MAEDTTNLAGVMFMVNSVRFKPVKLLSTNGTSTALGGDHALNLVPSEAVASGDNFVEARLNGLDVGLFVSRFFASLASVVESICAVFAAPKLTARLNRLAGCTAFLGWCVDFGTRPARILKAARIGENAGARLAVSSVSSKRGFVLRELIERHGPFALRASKDAERKVGWLGAWFHNFSLPQNSMYGVN